MRRGSLATRSRGPQPTTCHYHFNIGSRRRKFGCNHTSMSSRYSLQHYSGAREHPNLHAFIPAMNPQEAPPCRRPAGSNWTVRLPISPRMRRSCRSADTPASRGVPLFFQTKCRPYGRNPKQCTFIQQPVRIGRATRCAAPSSRRDVKAYPQQETGAIPM